MLCFYILSSIKAAGHELASADCVIWQTHFSSLLEAFCSAGWNFNALNSGCTLLTIESHIKANRIFIKDRQ